MKIEKIQFDGFKTKKRYASVDFSKQNVTVIYGDNGCGKTTFLKAISSFLSQDDNELRLLGISKITCNIKTPEKRSKIIVKVMEDGSYDWNKFENSPLVDSHSLSLGVERGITTQTIRLDPRVLVDFFSHPKRYQNLFGENHPMNIRRNKLYDLSEELSEFIRMRNARYRHRKPEFDFDKNHLYLQSIKIENIEELLLRRYRAARFTATRKIQSALFDTLSVAIDIENSLPINDADDDDLSSRLIESKDRIIEALDDGEENNFKTTIVDILNKIHHKNELKKVVDHPLLSHLFKNMIDELQVEKLILSSINMLIDKFNTYLINNKRLVVNGNEVYIEIDEDRHSVNELSSGERHILTFLSLVLFEGQGRNFLIIDEPEISLNIKWQRELMSTFSTLLPGTQIIVASHSPALAKRNPDFLSELKVWRV